MKNLHGSPQGHALPNKAISLLMAPEASCSLPYDMGLCRGHVGHVWLAWFVGLGCVNVCVNKNVHSYGCVSVFVHTDDVGPDL